VSAGNELAKAKMKHAEEVKGMKSSLEAKHKEGFDALHLLWDKDRDEPRKVEEEMRELRKKRESLTSEIGTLRTSQPAMENIKAVRKAGAQASTIIPQKFEQYCREVHEGAMKDLPNYEDGDLFKGDGRKPLETLSFYILGLAKQIAKLNKLRDESLN